MATPTLKNNSIIAYINSLPLVNKTFIAKNKSLRYTVKDFPFATFFFNDKNDTLSIDLRNSFKKTKLLKSKFPKIFRKPIIHNEKFWYNLILDNLEISTKSLKTLIYESYKKAYQLYRPPKLTLYRCDDSCVYDDKNLPLFVAEDIFDFNKTYENAIRIAHLFQYPAEVDDLELYITHNIYEHDAVMENRFTEIDEEIHKTMRNKVKRLKPWERAR